MVNMFNIREPDGWRNNMYIRPLNKNVLWVSNEVYEVIKNNPKSIIVESPFKPPIKLKVVGGYFGYGRKKRRKENEKIY